MKNTILYLVFILSSIAFLASCKDEAPEEPNDITIGQSFYPIKKGQFQTFLVKQTRYALNETPVTSTYQLKEVIGDEFVGENGEKLNEVLRYVRADGLDNFRLDSVFSVRKDDNVVVKMEHNIPYVKFDFPIEEGKTWNGNQFNARPLKDYLAEDVNISKSIGNSNFSNTLTIIESQDSSLVDKDLRYEIYANEVGLIYKKTESLLYCNQPECFGQKIIERGIISELTIFDWGIE
ncbi:hypothetical protein Fleli_1985 [Bernardetia litoralis DSM 6794]|uniref:Lipoprotein n=1 Tax=Bernardetia litoralis (strain ATCC 23117 / DSM 6794 / NBRC 15988 / NCIMB 1366 / Fx l1 / Sio-4) TaxID=880071 RepID=I4AK85_BERLS|nr:hypothetical protein [Bernardetia litoralis]AFM04370.1 hypothetical protein Fleli_1985 [Bernardetia litoralis DSM 6794]